MKKNLWLVIGVCFTMISYSANAEWYVSGNISQIDLDSIDTESAPLAGSTRRVDLDSDSDTGLGIAVGKKIADHSNGGLLLELNYQQSSVDIDEITFNGRLFSSDIGTAAGEIDIQTFGLDLIYQFDNGYWKPYVGAGIGITDVDVDAIYGGSIGAAPGTPPNINDSDSALSMRIRAGIEYAVSDAWGIFAEYQYQNVDDITVNRIGGGPGGLATTAQEGDFSSNSWLFGIKFNL